MSGGIGIGDTAKIEINAAVTLFAGMYSVRQDGDHSTAGVLGPN